MRKGLSRHEYLRQVQIDHVRFGEVSRNRSGVVTLRKPLPRTPIVWYEANPFYEDTNGRFVNDPTHATICAFVDGIASFFLYLENRKIETISFNLGISAAQLRRAILAMKYAGLGRFSRRALGDLRSELKRLGRLDRYVEREITSRIGKRPAVARTGCTGPTGRGGPCGRA